MKNVKKRGEFITSTDFLPCPFCGQETIYLKEGKDGGINCPGCLVHMPNECNDTQELIASWNSRFNDSSDGRKNG